MESLGDWRGGTVDRASLGRCAQRPTQPGDNHVAHARWLPVNTMLYQCSNRAFRVSDQGSKHFTGR